MYNTVVYFHTTLKVIYIITGIKVCRMMYICTGNIVWYIHHTRACMENEQKDTVTNAAWEVENWTECGHGSSGPERNCCFERMNEGFSRNQR